MIKYRHCISFVATAILLLTSALLWSSERSKNSCVGLHTLKKCRSADSCFFVDCPVGSYCIESLAQCIKPDTIGTSTCADSGSKKLELVVKGKTLPILEKCPNNQPICAIGQCASKDMVICYDSDKTNLTSLEEGGPFDKTTYDSLAKGGYVEIAVVGNPTETKSFKDKCKSSLFLQEQACAGGIAKEISVKCSKVSPGSTCKTDEGLAYCANIIKKTLAAGHHFTCAIMDDETVKCWGSNNYGQLGNGTNKNHELPMAVNGLGGAVSLETSEEHICAFLKDGIVNCWGRNNKGQLGDGTTTDRWTPTSVQGLNNAISIAVGSFHSCAILSDQTVRCWGSNKDGQLGNGTNEDSTVPIKVQELNNVSSLVAGYDYTCALINDGTVKCWGDNEGYQLGDGTKEDKLFPSTVPSLNNVVALSEGPHPCAILNNGTAKCWGTYIIKKNELGADSESIEMPTPTIINGLDDGVIMVATGFEHYCALLSNGQVKCWGLNVWGQLGDGTLENNTSPVYVQGLNNVNSLSMGYIHSCAFIGDKTFKCWGDNSQGQLGDGTTVDSLSPVEVKF